MVVLMACPARIPTCLLPFTLASVKRTLLMVAPSVNPKKPTLSSPDVMLSPFMVWPAPSSVPVNGSSSVPTGNHSPLRLMSFART